jgi:tRNA(fMet)-specific endonuclease VapC
VILIDTNHLTVLRYPEGWGHGTLVERMRRSPDQRFAVPVVVLEEQLRGWLAVIHQATDLDRQVEAYRRLAGLFEFFADWEIVCFDAAAVEVYQRLKRERTRVGTMDLRIAAITLANDALLLSADLSDFRRVPGLRLENWLA